MAEPHKAIIESSTSVMSTKWQDANVSDDHQVCPCGWVPQIA